MGWSCTANAMDTMMKIEEVSMEDSGTLNVLKNKNKAYMLEKSNVEHEDGSITGSIHEIIGDFRGEHLKIIKVGSFKIDGRTGKVIRPAWLAKKITKEKFEQIMRRR